MRVGCRLTSICRREENSEYRRRTSKSYSYILLDLPLVPHEASPSYPSPYRIDNETSTTLMVLPRIRDENRHLRVLMEDLLYTTVVHTPPEKPRASLLNTVCPLILFITELILAGQEIGRILARCVTGGGRRTRFVFIVQS